MTALIQFIVLTREGKWVVKSKDLERIFSVQQEAVDAAIRFANDSGKEGKPGVVLFQKSKSKWRGGCVIPFCLYHVPDVLRLDCTHSRWLIPLWPRAGGRSPYGTIFKRSAYVVQATLGTLY